MSLVYAECFLYQKVMEIELKDNEVVLITILRNFDFLRHLNYSIDEISLYGRTHYVTYKSFYNSILIKWCMWDYLHIEIDMSYLVLFNKKIVVSEEAKKYGYILTNGSVFEQITNFSSFIKQYYFELTKH